MLKRALQWLKQHLTISPRFIFIAFSGLIIFNLIFVTSYIVYSRHIAIKADREEMITQIVNTVYLTEISPAHEWARIAAVSKTRDMQVTTSKHAHYPTQFSRDKLWQVDELIVDDVKPVSFSVELGKDAWMNFEIDPHIHRYIPLIIIALEVFVGLALLFAAWTVERFAGPLERFKKIAEDLGVKLHTQPVVEYGPAIVRETADAMNQMQQRIVDLLKDRNLTLAAISHDLRTPLTRMKLRTQIVFQDQEQCQETMQDLDDMEQMIDQILVYSRDAAQQEDMVNLDLAALILSLCDERCEEGASVTCACPYNRLPFMGRPLSLKRALNNFILNAVKYADNVWVTVMSQGKEIIITIDDDGPGIPEEHLDKVFTPFYRVDTARSSTTGGTGLGLAIAQDVVHGHHGTVELANRPEGGLRVKVTFEV
ncbi:MAG: hypothetical protein CMF50_00275 [Legionellales bacterium]|nr:hypothetical protein [Legionellales bacterium]|tara:strand:+ start:19811 stop:21085 length:1275 start_codon:yes stop_codon:yes gene_type:complete